MAPDLRPCSSGRGFIYDNIYQFLVHSQFMVRILGAVHILRQPLEGGEGVSQKMTIADEGGRGGRPEDDDC